MKPLKNVLVGLDLTSIDQQLIQYSSFFTEMIRAEKVYFVHNIKRYEISEILEKEIQNLDLEKIITEELKETIEKNFKANIEWDILISDDPYTESLLSYVVNKYSIDLMILGNKNNKNGSGILAFKLLRTTRCQFLWVPENFHPKIEKIWVGTDFSNASKKSFSFTSYLEHKNKISAEAVHVYSLPYHFSPYVSNSKIQPKMDSYVDKKFNHFLKKVDHGEDMKQIKIIGREANIATRLKKEAYKNDVDLLVVADRGSNTFSNLTLGSVTEDLFNRELEIPLLIIKE